MLATDEVLPFEPNEDFIAHLIKTLEDRPGILYCSETFKDLLLSKSVSFIQVDNGLDFSDEVLLRLDQRTQRSLFNLIVSTSTFGMRGIDYRAEKIGANIFIAASFANKRDAL